MNGLKYTDEEILEVRLEMQARWKSFLAIHDDEERGTFNAICTLDDRAEIAALKEEVAENKKLRVAFDNVWAHREKHPPQHVFEQGQRFLLISLRTAMEAK